MLRPDRLMNESQKEPIAPRGREPLRPQKVDTERLTDSLRSRSAPSGAIPAWSRELYQPAYRAGNRPNLRFRSRFLLVVIDWPLIRNQRDRSKPPKQSEYPPPLSLQQSCPLLCRSQLSSSRA